jgi:hypothetical protein
MTTATLTVDEVTDYYRMVVDTMPAPTTKTHVELKNQFDVHSEMRMLELWTSSLTEAYRVLLEQKPLYARPDGRYRVFFCPSKKWVIGKYHYVVGCDPFLYGWNLVGRVIEDAWYGWNPEYHPFFVYACHHASVFLFSQMEAGFSITSHVGKTPMEILRYMKDTLSFSTPSKIEDIMSQWTDGTLPHADLIRLEFRYPRNLALFIFRRGASAFHHHQDHRFANSLLTSSLRILEQRAHKNLDSSILLKTTTSTTAMEDKKKEWIRRLENLLMANKLPLPSHQSESLKNTRQQRWTPKDIQQHEALRPNGSWASTNETMGMLCDPKKAMLILSEDNDAMSPLFPHDNLRYRDKVFPTVYHLAVTLMMHKLEVPWEEAYDKIYKKELGFVDFSKCTLDDEMDALWKKRMRVLLFSWMKTKMQQRPLWMRHLLLSKDVDSLYENTDLHSVEFIRIQMSKYVSLCHRRMQIHDKDRLECWKYLQTLGGVDPVLHERLERFLVHFLHTLLVARTDLGVDTQDLRMVKKLFRIVYPSLYVIASSYKEATTNTAIMPSGVSTGRPEVDAWLADMLRALAIAWNTGGGSTVGVGGGGLLKPKCMKETIRKVSLLYQMSDKRDDKAPSAIENILSGCCTWEEKDHEPFPRVATSLFAEYPGTKNADKTLKKNLGRVVMALHRNRAYQQF